MSWKQRLSNLHFWVTFKSEKTQSDTEYTTFCLKNVQCCALCCCPGFNCVYGKMSVAHPVIMRATVLFVTVHFLWMCFFLHLVGGKHLWQDFRHNQPLFFCCHIQETLSERAALFSWDHFSWFSVSRLRNVHLRDLFNVCSCLRVVEWSLHTWPFSRAAPFFLKLSLQRCVHRH